MVYEHLKLVLLLPVATTSVESIFCNGFSDNKVTKYGGDSLLDDCLVTFTERNIFFEVGEDDIIKIFMSLRKRQIK